MYADSRTVESPALPQLADSSATCDVTPAHSDFRWCASVGCLVARIHSDTFCALTRSTTSVASGVLLVLGGMSWGAGRTHSDWDGMFLMNLKLNKKIKSSQNKSLDVKWSLFQAFTLTDWRRLLPRLRPAGQWNRNQIHIVQDSSTHFQSLLTWHLDKGKKRHAQIVRNAFNLWDAHINWIILIMTNSPLLKL